MVKFDHIVPTPRAGETTLGKIMGYLQEYSEYVRWELLAETIDGIFPDSFPFDQVQNLLISVCSTLYSLVYQRAYNGGADKGNEINKEIFGYLDDLKAKMQEAIQAYAKLLYDKYIVPLQNKITSEIEPKLKDAVTQLSNMVTQIDGFKTNISTMNNTITSFDSSIKSFQGRLEMFNSTLSSLQSKASTIDGMIKDLQSKYARVDERLKALEKEKSGLPFKLPSIFES